MAGCSLAIRLIRLPQERPDGRFSDDSPAGWLGQRALVSEDEDIMIESKAILHAMLLVS